MPQNLEPQALLQRAYDISIGKEQGTIEEVLDALKGVNLIALHHVMYDSGISSNHEIRAELQENPYGVYASFIHAFIDACVTFGLYSRATLERIYLAKKP
jgi:hypothetical protein